MDRASSLERMVFMCDNCLVMMMSPDETSHIVILMEESCSSNALALAFIPSD